MIAWARCVAQQLHGSMLLGLQGKVALTRGCFITTSGQRWTIITQKCHIEADVY